MIYEKKIVGKSIYLRAVVAEDAECILKMRTDLDKAKFLHPVSCDVQKQAEWIKAHQKMDGDYYFMIMDEQDHAIGTVGISSIKDMCGEESRLISYGSPIQNIEANMLAIDFAFEILGLEMLKGYVASENREVISMQKKFGYVFEDESASKDGMDVVYTYLTPELYGLKRPRIEKMIEKALMK